MNTIAGPAQSAFSVPSFLMKPVEAVRPDELKKDQFQNGRPSFGKGATLVFGRHFIVFFTGVAATLTWQAYGNAARHLIAPAGSTPDQQQFDVISLDLDAVRRSIDGLAISIDTGIATSQEVRRSIDGLAISIGTSIATSQELTTRSVDQLMARLEQMTREIAKLQAVEQYALYKNSDPPPRLAPAQVPKPVPRPSQAPTPLTPARNP